MSYLTLKFLHVIGAVVILGTGTGIAFFMLMAHLSREVAFIARTAGVVVLADMLFTATAVVGGRSLGSGDGRTKKEAEQKAAQLAWRTLTAEAASGTGATTG